MLKEDNGLREVKLPQTITPRREERCADAKMEERHDWRIFAQVTIPQPVSPRS